MNKGLVNTITPLFEINKSAIKKLTDQYTNVLALLGKKEIIVMK